MWNRRRGVVALVALLLTTAALSAAKSTAPVIVAVSASSNYSLALDENGTVWAWGSNSAGQLGDGTFTSRAVPQRVLDPGSPSGYLEQVIAIAAGGHSLVLKQDGSVWGWGSNALGAVGDGTVTNRSLPVRVIDAGDPSGFLTAVAAISAGGSYSLAVKADGTVRGWGINDQGQLGDGTFVSPRIQPVATVDPADLTGRLTAVLAVSAGSQHAVALKSDGTVRAWGRNTVGQLGNGIATLTPQPAPVQVLDPSDPTGFLSDITAIDAGNSTTLALKRSGTVRAWGSNSNGQLGDGTTVDSFLPVEVTGLVRIVAIDEGTLFSLAVRNDGTTWAWGANGSGQLGIGTLTDALTAQQVRENSRPLRGVRAASAGSFHGLAMLKDGGVRAWGAKGTGQLGNGTRAFQPLPVIVGDGTGSLGDITAIAAGGAVSMARSRDARFHAWGNNTFGQLGDGTNISRSLATPGLLTAVATLSTGGTHALATRLDDSVHAWGLGTAGQLGAGNGSSSATPLDVAALFGMIGVSAGGQHTLALAPDGKAWGTGLNSTGQLGDGTATPRASPLPVRDPSDPSGLLQNVAAVVAGSNYSLARMANGTVRAWGLNAVGQLGDGTTSTRFTPVPVKDPLDPSRPLTGVAALSIGGAFTLALHDDGTVRGWGANTFGQLGDGSIVNQLLPVRVINPSNPTQPLTAVAAIAAGGAHSLALSATGQVWAWGQNSEGQLGDGTVDSRGLPALVRDPSDGTGWLTDVVAIAAGGVHSLALKSDGTVRAWGSGGQGQLGDGISPNETTAIVVTF